MSYVELKESGAAYVPVNIAHVNGRKMPAFDFMVDTGATRTMIPQYALMDYLGFTEDYILKNRQIVPPKNSPKMANGEPMNVYRIPITRINIFEHEIQHNYVLSSDTANVSYLLGLDILKYFNFAFNFDAISDDAPFGKMFLEFRKSRQQDFSNLGDSFAYRLDENN